MSSGGGRSLSSGNVRKTRFDLTQQPEPPPQSDDDEQPQHQLHHHHHHYHDAPSPRSRMVTCSTSPPRRSNIVEGYFGHPQSSPVQSPSRTPPCCQCKCPPTRSPRPKSFNEGGTHQSYSHLSLPPPHSQQLPPSSPSSHNLTTTITANASGSDPPPYIMLGVLYKYDASKQIFHVATSAPPDGADVAQITNQFEGATISQTGGSSPKPHQTSETRITSFTTTEMYPTPSHHHHHHQTACDSDVDAPAVASQKHVGLSGGGGPGTGYLSGCETGGLHHGANFTSDNETSHQHHPQQKQHQTTASSSTTHPGFNSLPRQSRIGPDFKPDNQYFIIKELVMTERTFVKDISLVVQSLGPHYPSSQVIVQMSNWHLQWLADLEHRLAGWERGQAKIIGDLLLQLSAVLHLYRSYLSQWVGLCHAVTHANLEAVSTYLPFSTLLSRPAHRLHHYQRLFDLYVSELQPDAPDYIEATVISAKIKELLAGFHHTIQQIEILRCLMEIRQDVTGFQQPGTAQSHSQVAQTSFPSISLNDSSFKLWRCGCLHKLTRRGFQPRLVLLTSEKLTLCHRCPNGKFKVSSCLTINGIKASVADPSAFPGHHAILLQYTSTSSSSSKHPEKGGDNSETETRALVLAAVNEIEMTHWLNDIHSCVSSVMRSEQQRGGTASGHPGFDVDIGSRNYNAPGGNPQVATSSENSHTRANSLTAVCWHRNLSAGKRHISIATQTSMSGYLLRKFKSSAGWQKLWVVLANATLFFFKHYKDDAPLAALPLIGYSVSAPSATDNVNKPFVIKLAYKQHTYFFRTESAISYHRWLEALSNSVGTPCTSLANSIESDVNQSFQ